jgi:hypothetical protein
MNDDFDLNRMGIDARLGPLLSLDDRGYAHHIRAIQCYSQWSKGISEQDVAHFFRIDIQAVREDLAHVRDLLPEEAIELHLREREELLASIAEGEELQRKIRESLSSAGETGLKNGRSPIDALRLYREAVLEDLSLIESLREKDRKNRTPDRRDPCTQVGGDRPTLRLPDQDLSPVERPQSEAEVHQRGSDAAHPSEARPAQKHSAGKRAGNGRRVSVRMDCKLYENLQQRSREIGLDFSATIRAAMDQYFDGDSASKVAPNAVMPAEAFALTGPFRAWPGDLRTELRKRLLALLALAYETARSWPRTKGLREVYLLLLEAASHLGIGSTGGQI